MAAPNPNFNKPKGFEANPGTLSGSAAQVDSSLDIVELEDLKVIGNIYVMHLKLNAVTFPSASSAALAVGQKLGSFPSGTGIVRPRWGSIKMVSTTDAAQAATAGEIGLGSVVGSGANATLGAVGATSEDFMEGQTIANHVAATELTSEEAGEPAAVTAGFFDASASAVDLFFNFATTYDNASTNTTQVAADIVVGFEVISENYGVPLG